MPYTYTLDRATEMRYPTARTRRNTVSSNYTTATRRSRSTSQASLLPTSTSSPALASEAEQIVRNSNPVFPSNFAGSLNESIIVSPSIPDSQDPIALTTTTDPAIANPADRSPRFQRLRVVYGRLPYRVRYILQFNWLDNQIVLGLMVVATVADLFLIAGSSPWGQGKNHTMGYEGLRG